ncbi:hypothetical protein SELMODRAFT_232026 [Selaginella moellendorffii]|uniref:Thioredoxin domain-containing protein n=1 Tax=Selaginella moellendorffii TaxID=88036 RepID=D8RQI9_SELML|nr:protein disulfide isomerase-like 2-3 [Selaginella moellendorffii]EFJ25662.1 hypothetical protein SELMODRAFT_232026 [Selaginella moellendorffii]|eukprot:XP_002973288.1 protein disulfide isomerase-like 2-3 [Selaginella moellendorffii]
MEMGRRSSRSALLLILLVLGIAGAAQGLYDASSDVVIVNPSNFKSKVLDAKGIVIVEFFANWCGHCKALAPAWDKAATALKGIVTIAAVDADTHKSLAAEYGLQGFPTIKVFGVGKSPIDYQGPREAKGIVEFALQQAKTLALDRLKSKKKSQDKEKKNPDKEKASIELTPTNFDEQVLKSNDIWLVEFFAPWCGHCKKLAPEWKNAAKRLKGKVKLGQVDGDAHKDLMSKYSVTGFPTILVFGADKQNPTVYQGARDASAIESHALQLLESSAVPPEVTELTGPEIMESHCSSAAICFVTFLPDILDSKADGRNQYLDILKNLATKFGKDPYGYLWAEAGKQPSLEKAVQVGGYGYPALVALNVKKAVFLPLRSAFEPSSVLDFVKDAGQGGKGNLPLGTGYEIVKTDPWDGKDGEAIPEEEFSLEELMAADENADAQSEL